MDDHRTGGTEGGEGVRVRVPDGDLVYVACGYDRSMSGILEESKQQTHVVTL